jgi:hypothetical protein
MDELPRSLAWLKRFDVDNGASRIFSALTPEQQEQIRRQGGLGVKNTSAMLMSRIRMFFGSPHFTDVFSANVTPCFETS